jgi:hypothetical protein
MNIQFDILVMLPELILAIGAMALLLVGAIGGEKTAPIVSGAAIGTAASSFASQHSDHHARSRRTGRSVGS